jgi:hypothetical protein
MSGRSTVRPRPRSLSGTRPYGVWTPIHVGAGVGREILGSIFAVTEKRTSLWRQAPMTPAL